MANERSRAGEPRRSKRVWTAVSTRPWLAWATARAVAFAVGLITYGINRGNVFIDITGYGRWAFATLNGTAIPYRDFSWEYPPMAMPAMLGPAFVTAILPTWRYLPYLVAWIAMVLLIDALIMRSIVRRAGTDVRHPALLIWILGPPLLGALSWTRFDIFAAASAFAAILYAGSKRSVVSGLASGVGATLKLWPSLLAPVQRTRGRAVLATVIAGCTVLAVAAVTFVLTGSTGFSQVLNYQSDRGLQIESLAALPLVWLHHFGVEGYGTRFAYGAWEITGPGVELLASLATVAFAIGLALVFLAHWRLMRRDASPRGVALTGVTLLLVILATNKVFSPQYVLWLLAVFAAAAVLDAPTWKRHVPTVLVLCGLTQLVFPIFYGDVLNTAWIGLVAMTIRDGVLLYLLVRVSRELLREVRATRVRERAVDDVSVRDESIALAMADSDLPSADFDDDLDPRQNSDA